MDQKNSSNTGAPSTDTTQALFVSARKKQLEQQEAERLAKEREEERLAAEAEVCRLEQEVAERKRRAQEEAKRVEEESALRREQAELDAKQAEEESARARAAAREAPPPENGPSPKEKAPAAKDAAKRGGAKPNRLLLIGGAAAAVIVVVILVVVLGSGGGSAFNTKDFTRSVSSTDGLTINYPTDWSNANFEASEGVFLISEDGLSMVIAVNITDTLDYAADNGIDAITAVEDLLYEAAGILASGGAITDMVPQLQKSGNTVQGEASFRYTNGSTPMKGFAKIVAGGSEGCALTLYAVADNKDADRQAQKCEAILSTLTVSAPSYGNAGGGWTEPAAGGAYWESDGRFTYMHDSATGLYAYIPADLAAWCESSDSGPGYAPCVTVGAWMTLHDYSQAYRDTVLEYGGTIESVAYALINSIATTDIDVGHGDVTMGSVYEEKSGTLRLDFGFETEAGWMTAALRINEWDNTCVIATGLDLVDSELEGFNVLASSAGVTMG